MVYDPYAGDPVLGQGRAATGDVGAVDPYTGQRDTLEERMTPGPRKILDTSYHQLPTREGGGMPWDNWQPPSFTGMADRVGTAVKQAYRDTPELFSPEQRKAVADSGFLGNWVLDPLMGVANTIPKGAAAVGTGVTANLAEIAGAGDPQKVRDAHALLTLAPIMAATAPPFVPNVARPNADLPPSARVQETMGPEPRPRTPLKTPEDAQPFVDALYKKADESGVVVDPGLTTGFLSDLDKYKPRSKAGLATEGPSPTNDLITRLKKLENEPIRDMQGIQDVDQQIQRAIDEQYTPTGMTTYGKQMRDILADFRQRTETVAPELKTARDAYAAQKRMEAVQRIIDNTEQYDNPASAIRTQVRTFLRNDRNTRGWTDEEIASLRRAGDSGFLTDYLRAEASRLSGIAMAVSPDLLTKVLGVPAQVALSYASRDALTNLKRNQLAKTMALTGERVPQPGRVAMPPAAPPPYPLLSTGTRYAPLTGLLADDRNQ